MHEPAREQERGRVSPVGGPSFLGLGDDRTNDLDYLLEEEPPRTHGRLYLALLLLVLSAGLLAWHWQRDGYPWTGLAQSPAPSKVAPAAAPEAAPTATAPASGAADPAGAQAQPAPATPGDSIRSTVANLKRGWNAARFPTAFDRHRSFSQPNRGGEASRSGHAFRRWRGSGRQRRKAIRRFAAGPGFGRASGSVGSAREGTFSRADRSACPSSKAGSGQAFADGSYRQP